MSAAQKITKHFGGDWHGSYGTFPAPGHSKADRGMTVCDKTDAPDGVLINTMNGANPLEVKDECRRLGLLPERAPRAAAWTETGLYDYRQADGTVAYRTVRLEKPGEKKRFVAKRPDGRGGWVNGLGEVERVIYRAPEIKAAIERAVLKDEPFPVVYLVEGERKADKLASWGLLATAVAFGCKGWRSSYAEPLAGCSVVILPDNDDEGRGFAERAAADIRRADGKPAIVHLPGLPPKGDIIDWTGSADNLRELSAEAMHGKPKPVNLLPIVNPATWSELHVPLREWQVEDWIPLRQFTLLTGRGGVGKSLLAQLLCTCTAIGAPFMGLRTRQAPALYLSCEDDADELWRRQAAICASLGITLADLDGKLHLAAMAGELGNHLATFDQSGRLTPSDRWNEVVATVEAHAIGFVALDNASHLMVGDHNDLTAVASFLNLLNRLAISCNGAGLILHHPNKAGDDWLGSVAWENQVRSRLVMKPSDTEGDRDGRFLENPKANYAPRGSRLDFRWHKGSFIRDSEIAADAMAELGATIAANADNDAFLRCLAERNRQNRPVSERPSVSYAPTVFEGMPEARGVTKRRLQAAMDRLFRVNRIERAFLYRDKAKGRDVEGLREVSPDASRAPQTPAPDASQTPPQTHPKPSPNLTPNDPPHTPYINIEGAALMAATSFEEEGRRDPFEPWPDDDEHGEGE